MIAQLGEQGLKTANFNFADFDSSFESINRPQKNTFPGAATEQEKASYTQLPSFIKGQSQTRNDSGLVNDVSGNSFEFEIAMFERRKSLLNNLSKEFLISVNFSNKIAILFQFFQPCLFLLIQVIDKVAPQNRTSNYYLSNLF